MDTGTITHGGVKYVRLEKLAYGHHSDGTSRKKLFYDVYVFTDGIPHVFAKGGKVLRSEGEADFIRKKLRSGLLYAVEGDALENHSIFLK